MRFAAAASLLLLGLTACAGEVANTGSTAAASTDACERFAVAACKRLDACDPVGAWLGRNYGSYSFTSEDRCHERFTLACEALRDSPGFALDDAKVDACTKRLDVSPCGEVALYPSQALSMCSLGPGTLGVGASCRFSAQCASGRCQKGEGPCGTCVATVAPGAPCGVCPEEQLCDGTCKALPHVGEACKGPCEQPLACVKGTCVSEGVKSECAAPSCSDRTDVVATGGCGPTGGVSGPSVHCVSGSACVGQNDYGAGTCAKLAKDGEPCGVGGAGPACEFPAVCKAATGSMGTCVVGSVGVCP